MLYLASSQAMGTVRRRAPCPVSRGVRTSQVATTSGRCFTEVHGLHFFIRMWDSPVAATGYSGKVKQEMFGLPFLGPSFTLGEQRGSLKGLLSHPGSCRRGTLFRSHHSASVWPRSLACRAWTEGRQLYPEPAPVIHGSIAEGFWAQSKKMKNTTQIGRKHVLMKFKVRRGVQSSTYWLVLSLRNLMAQNGLWSPAQWMVSGSCRWPCWSRSACTWASHWFYLCGFPPPLSSWQREANLWRQAAARGSTPDSSLGLPLEVFFTRGYFCKTAWFEIRVFSPLAELPTSIEPHLSVCQLYRWQLGPTMWSSPTTKSLDPIIVTALRMALGGSATDGFACNCMVPEVGENGGVRTFFICFAF